MGDTGVTNIQLKSLRNLIARKEAKGKDCAFEWDLYFNWIKDPDFKKADEENIQKGLYRRAEPTRRARAG